MATLLSHLPSRLESARPGALELYVRAKQKGVISGRIGVPDWLPQENSPTRAPRGPQATTEGVIVIPLDFAERLWAVTFALLILADHEGAGAMELLGIRATSEPPLPAVIAASAVFTEVMKGPLRPWPEFIPEPRDAGTPDGQTHRDLGWWVGRANGVFLDALTYLALHEVSHLLQGHAVQVSAAKKLVADGDLLRAAARAAGRKEPPPSPEELEARQTALEIEREADGSARDLLLGVGVDETAHLPRGYGAVMACTSSLVLAGSFRGLRQRLHPDHDVRLRQLLEAIDASRAEGVVDDKAPDEREALWRLAAVGMRIAASSWGARAELPAEIRDWPRLTLMLFDHLEREKDAAV